MHREIVLDTETTGLSPAEGDRVVEIGCVELINHIPTGKNYHVYNNPQRDMPDGAFKVHGLSEEFLSDKPLFADIAGEFHQFIADSPLIIHNAPFDMGFLNSELERAGGAQLQNPVIDTVKLARQVHPGARVSLDALCKHYGIDNTRRTLHGALLDAEILAEVYLELIGGRQVAMALSEDVNKPSTDQVKTSAPTNYGQRAKPLASRLSQMHKENHAKLLESAVTDAIWHKYSD